MPIVDKTNQMIQILPLPGNIKLTTNSQVVSGIANSMHDDSYTPNGQYIITASSYASDTTQPYNVFNSEEVAYWQTDFSGNTDYNVNTNSHPQYIQNPYNEGTPSTYRGGGSTSNMWVTTVGEVGKKQTYVKGEWIQIQLPYRIHLFRYSLLTPPYTETSTFPVKFMIVGSNDGQTWNYIDFRNTSTEGVPPISSHPFKLYNINTSQKYSYFRLIFCEMSGKIPYVKLNQWNLWGIPINRKNIDAVAPVVAYSKDDSYSMIENNILSGQTYTLIDFDKKPTVDECKTACLIDSSCNSFMYSGKSDPITNQPMWKCLASGDNTHGSLTSNDPSGFNTSTVYIKKQTKETFVGLDRGLELEYSRGPTLSRGESETKNERGSSPSSCPAVNNNSLRVLFYTNITVSCLALGLFAYTFAHLTK
jgi:hypothetical protein